MIQSYGMRREYRAIGLQLVGSNYETTAKLKLGNSQVVLEAVYDVCYDYLGFY